MKVLVINGSAKGERGNTQLVTDELLKKLKPDKSMIRFTINDTLKHCMDCMECLKKNVSCIIDDDMKE